MARTSGKKVTMGTPSSVCVVERKTDSTLLFLAAKYPRNHPVTMASLSWRTPSPPGWRAPPPAPSTARGGSLHLASFTAVDITEYSLSTTSLKVGSLELLGLGSSMGGT